MSRYLSAVLAVGSAPALWQRELARKTSWLDMLRLATAWTEENIAVQYTLNSEPLLGHSLVALTAHNQRSSTTEPVTTRQVRPKPSRENVPSKPMRSSVGETHERAQRAQSASEVKPPTATARSARPGSQAESARRGARAPLPLVDTRADRSLLRRLADEAILADKKESSRNRLGNSFKLGQISDHLAGLQEMAQQQRRSPRSWQHGLVTHASHMLRQPEPLVQAQVGQQQETLFKQWATSIGGPTAPLELLLSFASRSAQQKPVVKSRESARSNNLAEPVQPSVPDGNSWNELLARTPEPVLFKGNPSEAQLFDRGSNDTPISQEHLSESEQARRVMPPTLASELPPLLTPRSVEAPPLPVATGTLKLGGRAEVNLEDDLDMLAARIKRILDDEARRHGIDV